MQTGPIFYKAHETLATVTDSTAIALALVICVFISAFVASRLA